MGTRLSLLAVVCAALLAATPAHAQSPADSAAAPPLPESLAGEFARDRDRFELGAAVVSGPFDVIGTLGYHRFLRPGGNPFEFWMHVELAGGGKGNLREGAGSVAFLIRPTRTIRRDWPIRPILEFGPAAHVVMQVADIRGFGESAFHAKVYLKTHGYAGFEIPLGARMGLVARGRISVPSHRPLDYAQIALFLR